MKYSDVKYFDTLNGEGIRVSLFVSGCNHYCKGCFNKEAWDPCHGKEFDNLVKLEIFNYFEQYRTAVDGLSLLGGDPTFENNIDELIKFVIEFKEKFPEKNVWIWSGYTWEENQANINRKKLIDLCDILIDGKFNSDLSDLNLVFKGSSNQRVIDIKKSLLSKNIVIYM